MFHYMTCRLIFKGLSYGAVLCFSALTCWSARAEEPVVPQATQSEVDAVSQDGEAPDSGEAVEIAREVSFSNVRLTKAVATALASQGYFSGDWEGDREGFIKAVKNYQTLNGMKPTGVVAPQLAESLGVGADQYSPD